MGVTGRTIGILYPGDMGGALGRVLTGRGFRCVTTLAGRNGATARGCWDAGITVLASLADVVRTADVVLSVVPPAAAAEVVEDYCRHAGEAPAEALFVDVNSTSPEVAAELAARVEEHGVRFVDAAINGLAANLTTSATLFVSGARAAEVADLFGGAVATSVLGEEIGRAKAMKMLLAGVSKGTCALFLELAVLAERRGMLPELMEATARIYPGIAQLVERMLPTYAQHAGRRADEMRELESTAAASGLGPPVIEGVRQLHERLAGLSFDIGAGDGSVAGASAVSLVRHVNAAAALASNETAACEPVEWEKAR